VGYSTLVIVKLRSSYFEVRCEAPGCLATLRVGATRDYHQATQSLARRAQDGLISHGWTKDRRGLDMCPEHSRLQRAEPRQGPGGHPQHSAGDLTLASPKLHPDPGRTTS
jgi:hypothetical protein